MVYIGIDPGVKGAIAIVSAKGKLLEAIQFPTQKELSKKGRNMARTDLRELSDLFQRISDDYTVAKIMIEQPLLMPGQNVSSTFNNGKSHGIALAMLQVYFPTVELEAVAIKEWQEYMIPDRTFVVSKIRRDKRKQLKLDSIARAKELYPYFSFKKSAKSKVDSDGLTDAVLIATYCKHTYK